jgi:hypothetical protein
MGTTTDALPPEMVNTYSGFWPWRLLRRRQPLQTHRPPIGREGLRIGTLDSLECQTGPSSFQETTTAPGHRQEQEALKDGSSAGQSRGNPEKTGLGSETLANDEVEAEQNKVLGVKIETRTEAGTNSC